MTDRSQNKTKQRQVLLDFNWKLRGRGRECHLSTHSLSVLLNIYIALYARKMLQRDSKDFCPGGAQSK